MSQRGRTIFIGDIHGCRDELDALLDRVGYGDGDRVVAVGDMVVRGPEPRRTLALLRALRAQAVRGNHEERLLRWYDTRHTSSPAPIGEMTRRTARALSKSDFAMLKALPLWLDFPSHALRVVHAGVAPGVRIEDQDPHVLMNIRCVDKSGAPHTKRGEALWGAIYEGPPHLVFGHYARGEPQVHRWATGLDTGCVYGGRLTAMVLAEGQAPPAEDERMAVLVSVPARRAYVRP